MSVLKSKRKESQFEVFHHLIKPKVREVLIDLELEDLIVE